MTTPSGAELALLRTQPHYTRLHLSIYKPGTVLSARVNDGSIAKGERVITYDGASGDWNDVEVGHTLYVGTTAGGKEKGSIYVLDIDGSEITVGENSHINWEDDDYLTVIDFFQIWPVYPRYTSDGDDITIYKAYSFAYTNQNEKLGMIVCAGPHHAGFLDASGEHDVYYDSTGTEDMDGYTLSSYAWEFEGGTPTGSSSATPGNVTYDTPGHYTTKLTVTNSEGFFSYTFRHISIYDRPEEGTNTPILQWGLESLTGSRDAGGYSARIWVEDDVDDVDEGALVVIFADDYYGDTEQSIGGNAENREKIVFVGYILDGTLDYDYQRSRVTFSVGSPTEVMKMGEAFSVSIQDSENPIADASNPKKGGDPWYYLVDLSIKRAIYHYVKWHSTIMFCADLQYNTTDYLVQYFDADRTSLYDAIQTFMKTAILGNSVCDRQGKLWFEVEPEALDNASTVFPTSMFVDNHDWLGVVNITERRNNDFSYIEGGGIQYNGITASTGTFTPWLAAAPGETPAYRGKADKLSGLAITGSSHLMGLMGNLYAYRNSRYPDVGIEIAGNYRNFDVAPQELITLTTAPADNNLGVDWEAKPFAVRGIDWKYDAEDGLFRPRMSVAEVTQGFAGDNLVIPVVPPEDGFEQPPIVIPALPPPVIPVLPPIDIGIGGDSPFIPALWGWDGTDASETPRTSSSPREGTLVFDTSNQNSAWGFGAAGSTATVTVYMVFIYAAASSSTAALNNRVRYGACGGARSSETTGSTYVTIPSTGGAVTWHVGCFNPVTFSATAGDQLHCTGIRDASDASDTAGILHFAGWYILYA